MPKQIIVPDGMVEAVMANCVVVGVCQGKAVSLTTIAAREVLRRALEWLVANPIVPQTVDEYRKLLALKNYEISFDAQQFYYAEWQRRMFLAPEPKIPEAIKDLMPHYPDKESHEWAIVEAYRRGKEGR